MASKAKILGKILSDNSPAILTAAAVSGVVSTAVYAAKGAFHSAEILREAKYAEYEDDGLPTKQLSTKEKAELTWKFYIPAAAIGTATVACVLGANSISTRRNAALMSAFTLSERAFKEYQNKVVEIVGQNKEQKVRDELAQDRVTANPIATKEIIITGTGDVRCYDTITGRYFESSVEKIRKAQNDINFQVINDSYASLNDFFRLLGLPITSLGEEVGWRYDAQLDIDISTTMSEDGIPCVAMSYRNQPIRGYYKGY